MATRTMARGMILAAGFGTRLGELTALRPKPMLEICGTPLVRWSARWLAHHGVREVAVNLHHLGEQIRDNLGDGSELGLDIRYSEEEGMILGTGGGLRHARSLIDRGDDAPIVLVNGKIITDLDLGTLLQMHAARGAEATMVLRPDPNAAKWGSLQAHADGRIVRLLGAEPSSLEPGPRTEPATDPLMFTGIAIISPRFLERIPPDGEQCVVRTAYRSLFDEGKGLYAHVHDGYWWEHSTPERYLQGMANVVSERVKLAHAEFGQHGIDPKAVVSSDAEIVSPVWIGAGATVAAGATVGPCAQIGAGASIGANAKIENSIVWSNAVVDRAVADEVVPV